VREEELPRFLEGGGVRRGMAEEDLCPVVHKDSAAGTRGKDAVERVISERSDEEGKRRTGRALLPIRLRELKPRRRLLTRQ
jgi:hypothetical protein